MGKKIPWTREEEVILLDAYLGMRTALPGDKDHPAVESLSQTLRDLGQSRGVDIDDDYRNAAGCFMKLRNFQYLDTGTSGLKNASKLDRAVFERFSDDPIGLSLAITAINEGKAVPNDDPPHELPDGFNAKELSTAPDEFLLAVPNSTGIGGGAAVTPDIQLVGQVLSTETIKIPRYQRAYSWEEEQVVDLCRDLRALTIRMCEGGAFGKHFFGSIVVTPSNSAPVGIDIIDGQQRLTTFFLVLERLEAAFLYLADRAAAGGDLHIQRAANKSAEDVRGYLWVSRHDLDGNIAKYPRLQAPLEDRKFFESVVNHDPKPEDRASHALIVDALSVIWRELIGPVFADPSASEEQRHRALRLIQSAVLNGGNVIRLNATDTSTAYRLFMVLNDRGMQLSEGDLLRAETLERLTSHHAAFGRAAAAWDAVTGHESSVVQKFLRAYFPSRLGKRADPRNLVDEYVSELLLLDSRSLATEDDANELALEIEQMAEEMGRFAKLSEGLWPYVTPNASKAIQQRPARLIQTLKHELALPLLLAGAKVLTEKQFGELNLLLERFAFRYKNVGVGHADAAAVKYYAEARRIRSLKSAGGWSTSILRQELRPLLDTVDDSAFHQQVIAQLRYNRPGQRGNIKWLLTARQEFRTWYNATKKSAKPPYIDMAVTLDIDAAEIDHIYPQSANVADLNQKLEDVKHHLGNLALLEEKSNKIGGNTAFKSKRSVYRGMTSIADTVALAKKTSWNEKDVKSRDRELADFAVALCSF